MDDQMEGRKVRMERKKLLKTSVRVQYTYDRTDSTCIRIHPSPLRHNLRNLQLRLMIHTYKLRVTILLQGAGKVTSQHGAARLQQMGPLRCYAERISVRWDCCSACLLLW